MEHAHVLLLGATGVSGIDFISFYLDQPQDSRPYLTLYVRDKAKLPASVTASDVPKLRTVVGQLDSSPSLTKALKADGDFPTVTVAISLLGAYISVATIFTRLIWTPATPIADAFHTKIVPALKDAGVGRLMSLSTPFSTATAYERENMALKWKLNGIAPPLVVPQGHREMAGIGKVTSEESDPMEWTVFRVPFLTDGEDKGVIAGVLDGDYRGATQLSRRGMVKWLWREIVEQKWNKKLVMLGNA